MFLKFLSTIKREVRTAFRYQKDVLEGYKAALEREQQQTAYLRNILQNKEREYKEIIENLRIERDAAQRKLRSLQGENKDKAPRCVECKSINTEWLWKPVYQCKDCGTRCKRLVA